MKKSLFHNIIYLLIYVLLFLAGLKVVNSIFQYGDYWAHYQFSRDLLALSSESLESLLSRIEFPHIISYPLWHIATLIIQTIIEPIQSFLGRTEIITGVLASATSTSLFILAAYYVHKKYFLFYLSGKNNAFISRLLAFTIIFAGPWYIPFINRNYYLGQGILTAWHNPTHITVKFVAVICFYLSASYLDKKSIRNKSLWMKLGLLLVISAFIKPSFYQMFVPGLALYCLILLIQSKGKMFITCIGAGLSVIPVCIIALIQINMSFGSTTGGLGIKFLRVINEYSDYPVWSTILFLIFPIFVLIASVVQRYKDSKLCLAWCAFISGWGQYLLFYIQGDGWWKADFAWGYYLSVELVFAASIIAFWNICKKRKNMVLAITGWGLYGIHVVCGFLYYCSLLRPYPDISGGIKLSYIQYLFQ